MGFFGAAQGLWGEGACKKAHISYSDETWHIISYLKKFQKLYESRDTPLEFCWYKHFLPEINKFCYIKKYRHRFHLDTYFLTLLTFLESIRIVLINMVNILLMSGKMTTPGLLKIRNFWKKPMTSSVLSMTSPRQFYHVIQIIM